MEKYGKAVVAFIGLVVVFLINASSDGITPVEWAEAGVIAAGALTTFMVPLVPSMPAIKTIVALIATVAAALVGVLNDGWSVADAGVLVTEVLVFLGIAAAPAASPQTRTAVGWGTGVVSRGGQLVDG